MKQQTAISPRPIAGDKIGVLYLRVSTKEQAQRDGEIEGYSIPAQREANTRKADSLGVRIVAEFIDAGESARSANRPQLQLMLEYIREHRVDYVIVHKVDRLARNRADDVEINLALKAAGVSLISATENIDETPSGMLLHGIMSSIAEFYSQNLAAEVIKGMTQKVRKGGTPGRAPIGYLNTQTGMSEAGLIRSVIIDPVRGPIVQWMFEAYATGDWSTRTLLKEVAARGLTTVAGPRTPSKPLALSQLTRILRNPYYVGEVHYNGVTYEGRHAALIPRELFSRVQAILSSRVNGEKLREHPHYLKSTVRCGNCKSRLIVTKATNRWGVTYPYFVCLGRHQKRTDCLQRAIRIEAVEELVCQYYGQVRIGGTLLASLRKFLQTEITKFEKERSKHRTQLERRQQTLLNERTKLLHAHYAGAIPLDLLESEQARLNGGLDSVRARLLGATAASEALRINLDLALDMAHDCEAAYRQATPTVRRLFNQAFFSHLYITDNHDIEADLAVPFDTLLAIARDVEEVHGITSDSDGPGVLGKDTLTVADMEAIWNAHDRREPAVVGVDPRSTLSISLSGFERSDLGGPSVATFKPRAPLTEDETAQPILAQLVDGLANPPAEFSRLVEQLGPDRERWVPDRSAAIAEMRMPIPGPQRIPDSMEVQIANAYEAGASTTQLRQDFGVSQGCVVRVLQQHGIQTRFRSLTAPETARAKKLYKSGLSLVQIGQKFHRAPSTIRAALVRAGTVMRKRGGSHG